MGMIDYGEYKVAVRSMDENLIQLAKYPAINGRLPETENEVAITQAFLDRKGMSIEIGDTIQLGLTGGGQNYTVCGILPVTNSNYAIYVTPAFVKKAAENPLHIAYIHAKGTDALSEEGLKNYIRSLAGEWGVELRDVEFSDYYFSLILQRSFEYMAIIAFVIVIVTLACALVIYSWFFVSTIRKTNEYGKLRMIGATGRQVRRIVIKEERRLAVNTIPIGLIAGMAAGYILVPDGWNIASVLAVGVFVAAIMYLCVMLTIRRPAKFALKVTPIEAVCVALC